MNILKNLTRFLKAKKENNGGIDASISEMLKNEDKALFGAASSNMAEEAEEASLNVNTLASEHQSQDENRNETIETNISSNEIQMTKMDLNDDLIGLLKLEKGIEFEDTSEILKIVQDITAEELIDDLHDVLYELRTKIPHES